MIPIPITHEEVVPAATKECPYQVKVENGYRCVQTQEEYQQLSNNYNHDQNLQVGFVIGVILVLIVGGLIFINRMS